MNFYLVYKFSDYDALKDKIVSFINSNKNDNIFYFLPFGKEKATDWKIKSESKIKESDCVIFLRNMSNICPENEAYANINFELECAERNKKPILIAELDVKNGTASDSGDPIPSSIYLKKYNDKYSLKYKSVDSLNMQKIKDSIFNLESELFTNVQLSDEKKIEILLTEYSVMLDTSEKMMDRRQGTNNFYISICSAIIAAMAAIVATGMKTVLIGIILAVLSGVAMFLCSNWRKTLVSYGLSNQAKYEVLNMIEKQLPAALFNGEWKFGKTLHYQSYSSREINLPKGFYVFFVLILTAAVSIAVLSLFGVIPVNFFTDAV